MSTADVNTNKLNKILKKINEGNLDIINNDLSKRLKSSKKIAKSIIEMESKLPKLEENLELEENITN